MISIELKPTLLLPCAALRSFLNTYIMFSYRSKFEHWLWQLYIIYIYAQQPIMKTNVNIPNQYSTTTISIFHWIWGYFHLGIISKDYVPATCDCLAVYNWPKLICLLLGKHLDVKDIPPAVLFILFLHLWVHF